MPGSQFPPPPFDKAHAAFREFDAWWQDNPDAAQDPSTVGSTPGERITVQSATQSFQPIAGSYVSAPTPTGQIAPKWLGGVGGPGETLPQLQIPIASMLAELSADIVWGESPRLTLPLDDAGEGGKATIAKAQDRLNKIMGSDRARAEFIRSGEYASFQGGAYLAVTWDPTYDDHVTIRAYRSDVALPTFFLGRLISVELWSTFQEGDDYYRIFEKHEPGRITFSLWRGGKDDRGRQIPLREHAIGKPYEALRGGTDRAGLPEAEADDVTLPTGSQRLTVVYYPNKLPTPRWDKEALLRDLGRSDYEGLVPLFRQINATFGSLIRDLELGAGRISVPQEWLENLGPGQGSFFNTARAVYSGMNILDVEKAGAAAVTATQFAIRVDDHLGMFEGLLRIVLMKIGISPSTIGLKGDSGDVTATEVVDRVNQTGRTRDKKILYIKPAMSDLSQVSLEVDGAVFPGQGGGTFPPPAVEFPAISQIDPEKVARIISLLDTAGAISLWEAVKMRMPDADDDAIKLEIRRIVFERELQEPTDLDADPNTPPGTGDTAELDLETVGLPVSQRTR